MASGGTAWPNQVYDETRGKANDERHGAGRHTTRVDKGKQARSIPDFSARLAASFSLSGLDEATQFPIVPRDSLISALLAVAPGPEMQ